MPAVDLINPADVSPVQYSGAFTRRTRRPLSEVSLAVPAGTVMVKLFVVAVTMSYSCPANAATLDPSMRTRWPAR